MDIERALRELLGEDEVPEVATPEAPLELPLLEPLDVDLEILPAEWPPEPPRSASRPSGSSRAAR